MPSYTIKLTYSIETKSSQLFNGEQASTRKVGLGSESGSAKLHLQPQKVIIKKCAYLPGFLGAELDERRPAQEESKHVGHDVIDHHHQDR
jgi:hypothetical protein